MYEVKKLENWSNDYWEQIGRNIGLITFNEQELIRNTPIAILGVGGLGGPVAEQLIRAGCERITICDNDKFDISNLNRQICIKEDMGRYKIDVIEQILKKINAEVKIRKYYEVNENNILDILKNNKLIALTLDDPIASILIARECLKNNIALLESWGVPYLWAWWFTKNSVDYETCYGFDTHEITIKQIQKSEIIQVKMKKALLNNLLKFPNIRNTYDREHGAVEGMISGKLPFRSFAPIIRMSASFLAFEMIYTGILKVKKMTLAPQIVGYDYIQMKPIKFSLI